MRYFLILAASFGFTLLAWSVRAEERTLEHQAVIHAPVAEVWEAFTTGKGFESWAVAHAEVDLRIGGEMRTHYDPEGVLGDKNTIVNEILAFEPQRMLTLRNKQAPEGFAHAEYFGQTWSVTYFEPVDDLRDRTRVRIVGLGWGEGPEWDEVYAFFKKGNALTLQALQKKFAPNATTDDAGQVMGLLGKLVGGEWVHSGHLPGQPEGKVFRVRNVIEHGPDKKSLVMRGWLGNEDGMVAHSACLVWLQPGNASSESPAEVRFRNIDEGSGVVAGSIRLIGCDSVEWDWTRTGPKGERSRHRVTMSFVADDAYSMKIDHIAADGTVKTMVDADFERVAKAPAEFLKIRAE